MDAAAQARPYRDRRGLIDPTRYFLLRWGRAEKVISQSIPASLTLARSRALGIQWGLLALGWSLIDLWATSLPQYAPQSSRALRLTV
jgi:hypothetical protein